MGRKSRYSGYVEGMKKGTGAKNATVQTKGSIKNRINAMKEKSKKGVK